MNFSRQEGGRDGYRMLRKEGLVNTLDSRIVHQVTLVLESNEISASLWVNL
jgi:hypothetical protein